VTEPQTAPTQLRDPGKSDTNAEPHGPRVVIVMPAYNVARTLERMMRERFRREARAAAPRILLERVEKGHLGRKTGKGFYDHG
jgi:3-hydroxyacyl-CoA dehydrogenase